MGWNSTTVTPWAGRTERTYADGDVATDGQTGAPHKLAELDWAAALEADMQVGAGG